MQQRNNSIKFYTTGDDYDIFSNVTDIGFTINIGGKDYHPLSSEAVYQGLKAYSAGDTRSAENFFNDQRAPSSHLQREGNPIQNKLFMTSNDKINNTYEAYQASYRFYNAPQAVDIKEQVMYEILLAKFTQNPSLLKALLETGDKTLIENTQINTRYDDDFWGNGHSGFGRNALGIALMRVRENLGNEMRAQGKVRIRTGISDDLADALNIPPSVRPHPPQYLSEKQLDGQTAAITVSQFHGLKSHSDSSKKSPSLMNPFEGKDSPTVFIEKRLKDYGNDVKVSLAPDITDKKKGVLKFQFTSANDAALFDNWLKSKGVYVYQDNNLLVMSLEGKKGQPPKAEQVLEILGLDTFGRTHPQPTINSLHKQWAYQTANYEAKKTSSGPSKSGLFKGKQLPTDFIKEMLDKQKLNVSALVVGQDINDESKGVLKIKFHSAQDASRLSKFLASQGVPVFKKDNVIIMGLEGKQGQPPKAQQALQALGIGQYGRNHPKPIVDVLRRQWDDEKKSPSPRRKI